MLKGYWLVVAAVAAAVAAALINAVILLVNPCSSLSQTYYRYHCHADRIASELSWWILILIVLGPVSVVAYECGRVKSGERSILGAWLRSVAGALVSSLVAYSVLVGVGAGGQRFGLFSLYSGDAGFALLVLEFLALLLFGLTVIVPPIVFYAIRRARLPRSI